MIFFCWYSKQSVLIANNFRFLWSVVNLITLRRSHASFVALAWGSVLQLRWDSGAKHTNLVFLFVLFACYPQIIPIPIYTQHPPNTMNGLPIQNECEWIALTKIPVSTCAPPQNNNMVSLIINMECVANRESLPKTRRH